MISKALMIALPAVLLACPGKKKEAVQPTYEKPEIEWPEDEDLDDLPEAGEDTGEIK